MAIKNGHATLENLKRVFWLNVFNSTTHTNLYYIVARINYINIQIVICMHSVVKFSESE